MKACAETVSKAARPPETREALASQRLDEMNAFYKAQFDATQGSAFGASSAVSQPLFLFPVQEKKDDAGYGIQKMDETEIDAPSSVGARPRTNVSVVGLQACVLSLLGY